MPSRDLRFGQRTDDEPANRFAILATLDQPATKSREFHVSSARRVRVSKDAKKRRDLKRSKRKLDAQKLDAKLGHEMNKMLNVIETGLATETEMQSPTVPTPTLTPAPKESLPPALPETIELPSSPPALPVPQFSAFDLSSFPHLLTSSPEPIAIPPIIAIPDLPLRRSRIWSITKDEAWRDCLPTIFPSQSLPSPVRSGRQSQVYKELQIYGPRAKALATKPSRFFPPTDLLTAAGQGLSPTERAQTKLPRVACRLHATDNGSEDIVRPAKRAPTPFAVTEVIERSRTPAIRHTTKADYVQEPTVAAEPVKSTATAVECQSQESDDALLRELEPAAIIWHMITAVTTFDESKLKSASGGKPQEVFISTSVSQPAGQAQVTLTGTQTDETCGPFFCDRATAANLWNILSSVPSVRPVSELDDAFLASAIPLPAQTASEIDDLNHMILSRDHICASLFELQGSEIP
ncbi:hypothetical protein LTR95_018942, partial [Oleoguttula sp. CCFEE 5521]